MGNVWSKENCEMKVFSDFYQKDAAALGGGSDE